MRSTDRITPTVTPTAHEDPPPSSVTPVVDKSQTRPWTSFSSMSCFREKTLKISPILDSCLGECPICFEEMSQDTAQTLRCGHIFHESCCDRILNPQPERCPLCPLCRSPFIYAELFRDIEFERKDIIKRYFKRHGFLCQYKGLPIYKKRALLLCDFIYHFECGIHVLDMDFTRIEAQHIWNYSQTSHLTRIGVSSNKEYLRLLRALKDHIAKFEPSFILKSNKKGYCFWNADKLDQKYAIHTLKESIEFVKNNQKIIPELYR